VRIRGTEVNENAQVNYYALKNEIILPDGTRTPTWALSALLTAHQSTSVSVLRQCRRLLASSRCHVAIYCDHKSPPHR